MSKDIQTKTKQPTHGVDMAAHEEFLSFAEENPEAVPFVLRAEGIDDEARAQIQQWVDRSGVYNWSPLDRRPLLK